jgi:hypothetical protein
MKAPHSDDDVDLHGVLINDTPKIERLSLIDVRERRTPTLTSDFISRMIKDIIIHKEGIGHGASLEASRTTTCRAYR